MTKDRGERIELDFGECSGETCTDMDLGGWIDEEKLYEEYSGGAVRPPEVEAQPDSPVINEVVFRQKQGMRMKPCRDAILPTWLTRLRRVLMERHDVDNGGWQVTAGASGEPEELFPVGIEGTANALQAEADEVSRNGEAVVSGAQTLGSCHRRDRGASGDSQAGSPTTSRKSTWH